MKSLFSLILIFFTFHSFSQKTDSLKGLYSASLADTQQCNILNKIGMSYYSNEGQLDSSLKYLQQAKSIAYKSGSLRHQAQSLLNTAHVIREKGSFEKSIEDYFEALKIGEKLDNERIIGSAYSGIAVAYSIQKETAKALEYYEKALAIATKLNDKSRLGSLNNNIGLTYMDKNNFPMALKYMQVAHTIHKERGDDIGTATAAENIGLIYDKLKDYDLSVIYYTQALNLWRKTNDVYSIGINLGYMAMTFNNMKQYGRARDTAFHAMKLSIEAGAINNQVDLHNYLSVTYSGLKDFENALHHYRRGREISDSLKSDENIKTFTETQLKYSFYKQQLQDSLSYVLLVNKKEEQLKAEKTIRYFSFGAIAVFIVLLFFVLKGYREKKEANKVILHQKELVEEKQKEVIDSITYAKRIQTALLAGDKLLSENLREHFILFKPRDIVAGDFYWAAKSGNKFIYVTGDCTGHGVPGAFMSLLNISILSETIKEKKIIRPDEILNAVRNDIVSILNPEGSLEESKDGMDCVVVVLDKENKTLEYAGANNSFYLVRNGQLTVYKPDKMPVGKSHDNTTPFTYHKIQLEENDLVYTFTDGYADQFGGPKGKKFKYRQLMDTIVSVQHLPLFMQGSTLNKKFEEWRGDLQQVDDVCIIGIRI